jgi:hypothetical protein
MVGSDGRRLGISTAPSLYPPHALCPWPELSSGDEAARAGRVEGTLRTLGLSRARQHKAEQDGPDDWEGGAADAGSFLSGLETPERRRRSYTGRWAFR